MILKTGHLQWGSISAIISVLWARTVSAAKWFFRFVTKSRSTVGETSATANSFNDWVSLLNNATWSGGVAFAVSLLKDKSNSLEGAAWLAVSSFQWFMIFLTTALGLCAALVAADAVAYGRHGVTRFFLAVVFMVILGLISYGLFEALRLTFDDLIQAAAQTTAAPTN